MIDSLSYKLDNGKSQKANHEFECAGCERAVEEGWEFYFIARQKYCPDCMAEAIEEAKAWLDELESGPPEEKDGGEGDGQGDAGVAGEGEGAML